MKFLNKWLLVGIIAIAIILRFWQLGSVPPSPDWDEAALGYNAYSVLHTGRDEYGAFLPVVLRSFDDYKPALYTYLSIPSIALFGLSTFAVRFPSAVFGVLTILAVYFLVKEFFKKEKLALLSSFLLAISPWHIQFSRIAFESQVGLACNVFGVLFFLKGLKRPWLLFFSVTSFVASVYIYQSEKVFVPLLLAVSIVLFRKELLKIPKKFLVTPILLGLLLSIPMLFFILTNKNALLRAQGVSVFSDQSSLKQNVVRELVDRQNHDYLGLVLDNRRFVFAKEIVSNYLSHFDPNWLFITGDLSRHHAPRMGLLYLWELPFVSLGLNFLLFGQYEKRTKVLLFGWFLLAPVAASVTTGVPHAVRALNFLPIYQILVAIGIISLFNLLKEKKLILYTAVGIWGFLAILNVGYYLDQYFVQLNYYTSVDWQYGYKDAVSYVQSVEGKYSKIVVSNQPFLDQSYMFFLFYLKYDPASYQKENRFTSGGFRENHKFGKYEFRPIQWDKEDKSSNILYIGRPNDFPPSVHILKQVNYLNGQPAIKIVGE